jgi:hypothetical protein
MVGSLLFAAVQTRADIQHGVSQLGRYVSNPKLQHWNAAKRVLRYLKGTAGLGLKFHGFKQGVTNMILGPVFADANWARDLDNRRSTTGILVKLNGCAIAWKSRMQQSVAFSTAEAEYYALGDAAKELLWLRQMLKELGFEQESGTLLLGDNQAANITTKNNTHHSRMKHIDVRHHGIKESVERKQIAVRWCPTALQQADLLTKGLGRNIFENLRAKVMGHQGNSVDAEGIGQ